MKKERSIPSIKSIYFFKVLNKIINILFPLLYLSKLGIIKSKLKYCTFMHIHW